MITTHLEFDARLGDVLVREGHAGEWRLWDGKPFNNTEDLHFARLVERRDSTAFLKPILEPHNDDDAILQPS